MDIITDSYSREQGRKSVEKHKNHVMRMTYGFTPNELPTYKVGIKNILEIAEPRDDVERIRKIQNFRTQKEADTATTENTNALIDNEIRNIQEQINNVNVSSADAEILFQKLKELENKKLDKNDFQLTMKENTINTQVENAKRARDKMLANYDKDIAAVHDRLEESNYLQQQAVYIFGSIEQSLRRTEEFIYQMNYGRNQPPPPPQFNGNEYDAEQVPQWQPAPPPYPPPEYDAPFNGDVYDVGGEGAGGGLGGEPAVISALDHPRPRKPASALDYQYAPHYPDPEANYLRIRENPQPRNIPNIRDIQQSLIRQPTNIPRIRPEMRHQFSKQELEFFKQLLPKRHEPLQLEDQQAVEAVEGGGGGGGGGGDEAVLVSGRGGGDEAVLVSGGGGGDEAVLVSGAAGGGGGVEGSGNHPEDKIILKGKYLIVNNNNNLYAKVPTTIEEHAAILTAINKNYGIKGIDVSKLKSKADGGYGKKAIAQIWEDNKHFVHTPGSGSHKKPVQY